MLELMQGDERIIPIEILDQDGVVANEGTFADVEVSVGQVSQSLSSGELTYDTELKAFLFRLTQNDTFKKLGVREKMQVRVKTFNGEVVGINVGEYQINNSLSKSVL